MNDTFCAQSSFTTGVNQGLSAGYVSPLSEATKVISGLPMLYARLTQYREKLEFEICEKRKEVTQVDQALAELERMASVTVDGG